MRIFSLIAGTFLLSVFFSCKTSSDKILKAKPAVKDTTVIENFFPVSDFIRGEIIAVKNSGITPRLILTTNSKTDTTFLKTEELDSIFAPFLNPKIDTANLKNTFSEASFLDQTLNRYTFTYTRKQDEHLFPELVTWNVYLTTDDAKVSSVYIEKNPQPGVRELLTWKTGKSCKIVTIKNNKVSEEKLIIWNYDEDE